MKKLLLILLLPVLMIGVFSGRAHASTQDFVINNFDANYTLSNKDKQGELRIVEKIDLTFNDFNHGILRAIPKSYKNHPLKMKVNGVTSTSGAATNYTTYTENGNTVLKIGDAGRTITGPQEYTIDYTLSNVIGFYKDHDELYWDINGDQWQQQFEHVRVQLHLPAGYGYDGNKPVCYTGAYGATSSSCTIKPESLNDTLITSETTQALNAYETLTIVVGFNKGYFAPYTFADYAADYAARVVPLVLLPIFVGGYAFKRWRKLGRDPKGSMTVVPEYEAPDGLKPMEVGSILDFKADTKDMSATIVDLAVRGYIKIIETKKDRLIGKDKLDYSFEFTGKDDAGLLPYEKTILNGISSDHTAGTNVPISKLKDKFYLTAKTVQTDVMDRVVKAGYFASSPTLAGGRLLVIGGALIFGSFFAFGFNAGLGGGMIISGIISLIFGLMMPARTAKGVAAKDKLKGLKLYLETAEKDRIAMLQSPDAKYAANHEAPKKTVNLFEKLLPYAMILGVENEWAKQFEGIYNTPPDWFVGNWSSFNTGLFIGSLNGSMASVNAVAFSSPSSSGSSGFGGGGFSGGGGGGGGGGGW